jgi:hypothetical protein
VLGPRAGQKVLSLRTVPGRDEKITHGLCADAHGFNLHAAAQISAINSNDCAVPSRALRTRTNGCFSGAGYGRSGSLCDRQLSKLIAVKQPVNFRFPKAAFR